MSEEVNLISSVIGLGSILLNFFLAYDNKHQRDVRQAAESDKQHLQNERNLQAQQYQDYYEKSKKLERELAVARETAFETRERMFHDPDDIPAFVWESGPEYVEVCETLKGSTEE